MRTRLPRVLVSVAAAEAFNQSGNHRRHLAPSDSDGAQHILIVTRVPSSSNGSGISLAFENGKSKYQQQNPRRQMRTSRIETIMDLTKQDSTSGTTLVTNLQMDWGPPIELQTNHLKWGCTMIKKLLARK